MKKYVSREDVDKGLVDPTKPLNQQKDYLQKIQKEQREKNKNKDNQKDKEKPKHENQYKRKERQNKIKYNWNRRDVIQTTPVPDAPKKQVPKPDKQKFLNDLNALKKQIQDLNKKKSQLIHELGSTIRNRSDNKKSSNIIKTKYSSVLNQKFNIKKGLQEEMKLLQQKRDEIERQFNRYKEKIVSLRKPQSFEDCSTEQLQKRLQKTQTKLTTAQIDKKQQNRINMRILQIKRALQKSRSDVEINAQVTKYQDQNQILFRQLKDIKAEISNKYNLLKTIKGEIAQINENLNKQKKQPQDTRTNEQIKNDYEKRIEQVNQQKDKVKKRIDNLRDQFDKTQDQYDDYKDLVDYIKMVTQQKQKIKKWKQQQQRIKQEKIEQEKRRQKQKEEQQKRRKQKQQREQLRRKQVQERKEKLQKQRQQYINRNPHHEKIQLCRHLIDYCQSLKPQNAAKKVEKRQQKTFQPILQLKPTDSKDWQKQLKKGAQVIVSKKLREQEETKKVVKQKKKKEKQTVTQTNSGFTHHIQTSRMFDQINLLPPLTAAQIDQTVKQLNERIQLFNKPTQQQVATFKERAARQFDQRHGIYDQDRQDRGRGRKQLNYKQKNGEQTSNTEYKQNTEHEQRKQKQAPVKTKRSDKKEVMPTQKDFPGLN